MAFPQKSALRQTLESGGFPVNFEVTPPKEALPQVLLRRARALGDLPTAINVISRPGRQDSLVASTLLKAEGLEPVWHLVGRGKDRGQVQKELGVAAHHSVANLLCLRGDGVGLPPWGLTARELVQEARAAQGPGTPFFVGAGIDPSRGDAATVQRRVRAFVEAGVDFLQTQPLYDPDHVRFIRQVLDESPRRVYLIAGVMPILQREDLAKIPERLGIVLPPGVVKRLESCSDVYREGMQLLRETLVALRPLAHGVALMCFKFDLPPPLAEELRGVLCQTLPESCP